MAYTKQYFEDGDVLKAEQLNAMDAAIESNEAATVRNTQAIAANTQSLDALPGWSKQPQKPTYTAAEVGARPDTWMPTPEQVGADPTGTATATVGRHNTDADAHEDIRLLVQELTARLNALANSEDVDLDQMAELVAYIKDNRELIEQITTNKVSVSDIVNNLTTNVSNKPLSAAQGVALKALIDAIKVPTKVSELSNDENYAKKSELPTVPTNVSAFTNDVGYAKKTELPTVPTKLSELTNDKGYLTAVPSEYVTETELAAKKYLSAVPSEYVTESELIAKGYVTEEDVQEILSDDGIPEYWKVHLDTKISEVKARQDEGGKDAVSYIVITDMHYTSNLGKISPLLARYIMDRCDIKFVLILGDLRTRGLKLTKEEAETEWNDVFVMLNPIHENVLLTQGNHDAGFGKGDYDGDGDTDNYAYEFTPAEMFNRVYRKAGMVGDVHYDASGTAYYIDDVMNRTRFILLNTQLNFEGNKGYSSYETVSDGAGGKMAKYPAMWKYRYTQCQYDFLINDALATVPDDDWKVVMGSHVPINQTGEMPEFPVMIGVLQAYKNKTAYSGSYEGTASGGAAYTNLAEPLPNNTTDTSKWVNGYRFGSGGSISAENSGTPSTLSNRISCEPGGVIRITGTTLRNNSDRFVAYYMKDGVETGGAAYWNAASNFWTCTQVDDTYEITVSKYGNYAPYAFRFAMPTPTDASAVIITVNEEIVEGGVAPYDAVSVECDFTNAKGNLIAYHGGHNHKDEASFTCYQGGVINFPIITTQCDGQEENDATLKAQRVAGTITEQSFDVFTVTPDKIYATKIGAGDDRVINY